MTHNPIVKSLTSGNCYLIKGYRDSSGTVKDLACRHAGRAGYLRLTRESLDQLDEAYQAALQENPAYDPQLTLDALEALAASLKARLDEEREPVAYASKESFTPVETDISYKDNDPSLVVVNRIEVLLETIREAPEAKPKKASAAHFRSLIEAKLPVSRYCHRLNLYPGKFEAVLPDGQDRP